MQSMPSMEAIETGPHGGVILVADDNPTVGRVISKILEKEGYRVRQVAEGHAALDVLFSQHLDLALLDADLPGVNARELTNLYRFGSRGRPHLPILGLIQDMDAPTLCAWIDAGLDGCIGKPIEPMELIDAVNSCLGKSESRQPAPQSSAIAAPSGPAIDPRVLCDLEKLGGGDFVDDVITQFVTDASRLLPELTASVAANDTALFRDQIHALRSCAGNVGAVGLYKLCLASQTTAPRELMGEGSNYVAQLTAEFQRAAAALDQREWRSPEPLQNVG